MSLTTATAFIKIYDFSARILNPANRWDIGATDLFGIAATALKDQPGFNGFRSTPNFSPKKLCFGRNFRRKPRHKQFRKPLSLKVRKVKEAGRWSNLHLIESWVDRIQSDQKLSTQKLVECLHVCPQTGLAQGLGPWRGLGHTFPVNQGLRALGSPKGALGGLSWFRSL